MGTFDYEKSEHQVSHPAWKDNHSIVVWGPHNGSIHYHLYDEKTGTVQVIGADTLIENGHMTYSRDGRRFYTPPDLGKHNRCDLHPRWSPDNKFVSIDSTHEGSRQQYILDVSDVLELA